MDIKSLRPNLNVILNLKISWFLVLQYERYIFNDHVDY